MSPPQHLGMAVTTANNLPRGVQHPEGSRRMPDQAELFFLHTRGEHMLCTFRSRMVSVPSEAQHHHSTTLPKEPYFPLLHTSRGN